MAWLLSACAGREAPLEGPGSGTHRAPGGAPSRTEQQAAAAPALESRQLTIVPGGTFGPYVARAGDSAVLVWATRDDEGHGHWHSLNVQSAEAPPSEPLELAPAPDDLSLVAVRQAGEGKGAGYVVVNAEPGDFPSVRAFLLGKEGQLQGGPHELAQAGGAVLWVDALPGKQAPLVFWAVSVRGLADLYACRLDETREVHKIASDALAWQIAPQGSGAALATVRQNGVKRDVALRFIDAAGQSTGKSLVLRSRSEAQLDLDMVNLEDHLVVAWSEQSHLEPVLYAAAVDPAGRISQTAKRLTAPMGEQALVRLVRPAPGQAQGYVLWENLNQARDDRRLLQVAPLLSNATLGKARASLEMYGEASTLPEFAANGAGLSALSQAPLCLEPPEPCQTPEVWPTYVEFDKELRPIASEPIRPSSTRGTTVDLAWGLGCNKEGCTTLAAPKAGPAPIYWVKLQQATKVFKPIAWQNDEGQRPRLAANEALQELDPLADLAARPSAGAELVAWITYFDPTLPYERPKAPAPDGRLAPVRALLQTLHSSNLTNEPTTISLRARSLGGVSLAEGKGGDFLLGWAAIDHQVPQVFVTLVNAQGQRKQLKMLTHSPGEVSDIALTRLDSGWVVGWVDERDGDPEVYAMKLADNLVPMTGEQRLTQAKGGAADLTLTTLGDRVLAVWGDARGAEQQGVADVYTKIVSAGDLSAETAEQPLERTPGHSHTIRVGRTAHGPVVAWIENASGEESQSEIHVAQLDEHGRRQGAVIRIEVGAANLSGLALDCANDSCHLVFGGAQGDQAVLWASTLHADRTTSTNVLTGLSGSPSQQLMPTLAGDVVFVAEQTSDGQARLRRLNVQWE